MINKDLSDFLRNFSTVLPKTVDPIKKGAVEEVNAFLEKHGLVTREAFETQAKVLAQLQEKLKHLEAQIENLK